MFHSDKLIVKVLLKSIGKLDKIKDEFTSTNKFNRIMNCELELVFIQLFICSTFLREMYERN